MEYFFIDSSEDESTLNSFFRTLEYRIPPISSLLPVHQHFHYRNKMDDLHSFLEYFYIHLFPNHSKDVSNAILIHTMTRNAYVNTYVYI